MPTLGLLVTFYTGALSLIRPSMLDLIMGAPKRYILDKTDEGFTNVPLMSQRRHSQTDKGYKVLLVS